MPKKWHGEKCAFCSLCVGLCPHDAFVLRGETVEYISSRCRDCEICPPSLGCPRRAIL